MDKCCNKPSYAQVIGLTGMIGGGKSTVAKMFGELGAVIIEADVLARQVLTPDYPKFQNIKKKINKVFYTNKVQLFEGDNLNRSLLAELVFRSSQEIIKLNNIIHPEVEKMFFEKLASVSKDKIIFYDIPLLFELGLNKKVSKVVVVQSDFQTSIQRAAKRLKTSIEDILHRNRSQISLSLKLNSADIIIDNRLSKENTSKQVCEIWEKIIHEKYLRNSAGS